MITKDEETRRVLKNVALDVCLLSAHISYDPAMSEKDKRRAEQASRLVMNIARANNINFGKGKP